MLTAAPFSCKNELRLCDETLMYDNSFDLPIDEWHSICDPHVSWELSTPAISSLTATLDPQACDRIYTACESAIVLKSECKMSATADLDLLSCMCKPPMTSLYSVCYYDGNISCLLQIGNIESVPGRSFCQHLQTAPVRKTPHIAETWQLTMYRHQ